MNGVPMNLDYSKTLNDQLPTVKYYEDRYKMMAISVQQLMNIINATYEFIEKERETNLSNIGTKYYDPSLESLLAKIESKLRGEENE